MKTTTNKKVTFAKYDPAEYINNKETAIAFLEGALEENDPDFLLETIGYIARSKSMSQVAKELGIDRAGLYKSLSPEGNPSFKTVFKLLDILGYQLSVRQKVPA